MYEVNGRDFTDPVLTPEDKQQFVLKTRPVTLNFVRGREISPRIASNRSPRGMVASQKS